MQETRSNYSLEEMDQRSVFHPLTSVAAHMEHGPHIINEARGVRLKDHKARNLIDCGAGLWCVNAGYGRSEIAAAASSAIENLNYYHIFGSASNEPIIRLADRVLTLFHEQADAKHLARVFFGCSGSDANDTNVKLVRYYNNLRGQPRKKKIISRHGAYHGLTCVFRQLDGHSCLSQGLGSANRGRSSHVLPTLVPACGTWREPRLLLRPLDWRP